MPQNTREPAPPADDVSDIVSVIESDAGGTKDIRVSTAGKKGRPRKEKKELAL
jgi:hypothetical protein